MIFRASLFCFQEKQASRAKNKPFPGPPGPKEDQGHLGKTRAQGPQGAKGEKRRDGTGTSGVNYVRWGRTSCPNGTETVYQGKKNR